MLHLLGERARGWLEPDRGSWAPATGLALALGCAYFLAARLGLTLLNEIEGTAVLWPAAGVAAGALMVLGRSTHTATAIAAAVIGGTVAAALMAGRSAWAAAGFGFCNAGEALLMAWLVERWCGKPFLLDDWRGLWGFLAAAALAATAAGLGGALILAAIPGTPSFPVSWRMWATADALGIVIVAPLVIGLNRLTTDPLPRSEALEGIAALALVTAAAGALYLSPTTSWLARAPASVLFPFVLWIAARCRPVFAAAAAVAGAGVLAGGVTFGLGRLGDATVTVPVVQVMILIGSLCVLSLSTLFSERRRSETALRDSNDRLQLALNGAELGVWSVDLATNFIESDERDRRINAQDPAQPARTLAEARRFVHPEDLPRLDAAFSAARRSGTPCRTEYRVRPPADSASPGSPRVRWVAVEGSVVRDAAGRAVRLLGVTRDITERKLAEEALAERTAQLALAGRAGLVGSYAYDVATGMIQTSGGFAAIYGLPEGTKEIERQDWLARVHPDDVAMFEQRRARTIAARQPEVLWEYRITRPDGEVRWIEQRSRLTYDEAGALRRSVGVHIDVTERKRDEEHKSLLVAELDHRVKNVLAVVSALIARSRASADSAADLVAALDGRVKSMATTHELLSGRKWHGLSLGELIRRELEPYATDSNVATDGPDVLLKAEAGQALGMVVHELITNAAKYGALSVERGRVSVRWRRVPLNGAGAHLMLEWQETDGPTVVPSSRVGYGTSVIRDLIPYELGGRADLAFPPEGVRCRLEVPAKWLGRDAGR